jgi:ABC-2 type transport system ATP-binding protein
VQKVCTHFAVLKKGKKIHTGTVDEALNADKSVEISARDMDKLISATNEFRHIKKLDAGKNLLTIQLNGESTTYDLNAFLIEKGIVLTHLAEKKGSLEQKFLKILEESDDQTV